MTVDVISFYKETAEGWVKNDYSYDWEYLTHEAAEQELANIRNYFLSAVGRGDRSVTEVGPIVKEGDRVYFEYVGQWGAQRQRIEVHKTRGKTAEEIVNEAGLL